MEKSSQELKVNYLKEQLTLAIKARNALFQSYESITPRVPLSREGFVELSEKLEALSSRFSRPVDILTQKLFRAIDAVEFEDEGTLLDRLNRMEKRRIISSAERWREIWELRNQIAHEYSLETIEPLYEAVIRECSHVLETVSPVEAYLKKKILIN
ncbi:MAG: hypothetical protein HY547_06505 [Elusimicrobia bacterium]|nr:hypothetical protein [Elusimicrobiota bacterium]